MKKYLVIVVLLALALAFVGCGNGDDVPDAPSDDPPATADDVVVDDTVDEDAGDIGEAPTQTDVEVTTFTVLAGSSKSFDNPVAQEITARTGVRLEFDLIVGDAEERINLMTAAGQFTDIVMTPHIGSMTTMIRANALVALDDYFVSHGPNLLAMYGPYLERMRHSLEFPYIYGVGTGVDALGEGGHGRHWGEGFWVQNRALREQGFPEIVTLEDFEAVIRRDVEENPYTEDGLQRFGMSINATDGWRFIFSLIHVPQIINGYSQGHFIIDDSGGFVIAARQQWYQDYMRWLNHLWNDGLIDPESFTQDYATYQAKLAAGRVSGTIDAFWQFFGVVEEMVQNNRDDYAFMPFDIFADPSIRETRYRFDSVAGPGGFSITRAASDVGKIVSFFDFLASEEGGILKRWGLYGINHTIDPATGLRVRTEQDQQDMINDHVEFQERTGVNYFTGGVNEWLCLPRGLVRDANGICLVHQEPDLEGTAAMFGEVEREVLAAYGQTFFTDVFVCPSTLPIFRYGSLGFAGSDDDFVIMAYEQYDQMYFPGLVATIVAERENFDAEWERFMADIDATNIDLHIEHLNQQLEERRELWGLN